MLARAGFCSPAVEPPIMSNPTFTRRELAHRALAGAAGAVLATTLASQGRAQVVDPTPIAPPPLPMTTPIDPTSTAPASAGEDALLIALVPLVAGYALTEAQAREVGLALKDYPSGFAKARAYVLPDDVGPAFAANAPTRKEHTR